MPFSDTQNLCIEHRKSRESAVSEEQTLRAPFHAIAILSFFSSITQSRTVFSAKDSFAWLLEQQHTIKWVCGRWSLTSSMFTGIRTRKREVKLKLPLCRNQNHSIYATGSLAGMELIRRRTAIETWKVPMTWFNKQVYQEVYTQAHYTSLRVRMPTIGSLIRLFGANTLIRFESLSRWTDWVCCALYSIIVFFIGCCLVFETSSEV